MLRGNRLINDLTSVESTSRELNESYPFQAGNTSYYEINANKYTGKINQNSNLTPTSRQLEQMDLVDNSESDSMKSKPLNCEMEADIDEDIAFGEKLLL